MLPLDEVEFRTAMAPVRRKEGSMKLSTVFIAVCFALVPFAAHATAQQHHALHRAHQAQRHAIPLAATALVPAVKLDNDSDSDGLSRSHEDCNRGCIDN
jgi:hypothetical protein